MKMFRKVNGQKVTDVVEHTLNIIRKDPTVEIHIGTDSQSEGEITTYVTALAYRYGNKGVHYIYWREKIPRINDKFTKLYREAELTIEFAEWFTERVKSVRVELDFDYNKDERYFSQKLVASTKGWAEGLGYKVNIKPGKLIASHAADYHCR
jgi:predicted RNase H-related nuclease YkuK (DUF458 family)